MLKIAKRKTSTSFTLSNQNLSLKKPLKSRQKGLLDGEVVVLERLQVRFGVCEWPRRRERDSGREEGSDAGMLHLLDNPICSVISRTHYWSGDGSALIKASTSVLRAFMRTDTHTQVDLFLVKSHPRSLEDMLRWEGILRTKWVKMFVSVTFQKHAE